MLHILEGLSSECDIFLLLKPAQIYPKGLRAESARAVAGRRCPHRGEGEDFFISCFLPVRERRTPSGFHSLIQSLPVDP